MTSEIDALIHSLTTSTFETPQISLSLWLDQLYSDVPKIGLSSAQLISLIRFVSESSVLTILTKIYIIEHCLIPNDYISRDVPQEIARHLGTATAISEFKLQTPFKIQVALCKWLAQVYFILIPEDNKPTRDSDFWIHFWQFRYLQHWVTYIMLWSSATIADVKRWKVLLLERIAKKPSYQYGSAYATLILLRYSSVIGESKLISDTIGNLNCNKRRLKSLQNFRIDMNFLQIVRKTLTNNPYSKFTDEIIDELVASHLSQLQDPVNNRHVNRLSSTAKKSNVIHLQNLGSLSELVRNWNIIPEPKNLEPISEDSVPLPLMFYVLQFENTKDGDKASWRWMSITLKRIFSCNTNRLEYERCIEGIAHFCLVDDVHIVTIIDEFFTLENLKRNPKVFSNLWSKILSIPSSVSIEVKLKNTIQQILAYFYLNRFKQKKNFNVTFSTTIEYLRRKINSSSFEYNETLIEILYYLLTLLINDCQKVSENRYMSIYMMKSLQILSETEYGQTLMSPNILHNLMISTDPLIIDATCLYLMNSRRYLLNLSPNNQLVKNQNQYIMDFTNLLWRNKLRNSRVVLNVPIEFIETTIDNLYLPIKDQKIRVLFSITGIAALSYVSIMALRHLEKKNGATVFFNGVLTEERFKRFKFEIAKDDEWFGSFANLGDLKIEILKELRKNSPYRNIPLFLFTHLKSLSQYI